MQVRQLNKYNFVVDSFLFSFNRSISSPVHSVLVNDGSMCGESSFCQKNTCVQQKTERSCDSLKTCSGNGVSHSHFQFPLSFFLFLLVCTTMDVCFCNPSWKGNDCSIYDYKHEDLRLYNRSLPFATGLFSFHEIVFSISLH